MAILVLSSRQFGLLAREALDANSLKIKRMIEKALKPKNAHQTLRINLKPQDFRDINGMIYNLDFTQRGYKDAEGLARALDDFGSAEISLAESGIEPPYIAYSMSEWKAIVEIATGVESFINLNNPNLQPVFYDMRPLYDHLKPLVLAMIARGNSGRISEEQKAEDRKEHQALVEQQEKQAAKWYE